MVHSSAYNVKACFIQNVCLNGLNSLVHVPCADFRMYVSMFLSLSRTSIYV